MARPEPEVEGGHEASVGRMVRVVVADAAQLSIVSAVISLVALVPAVATQRWWGALVYGVAAMVGGAIFGLARRAAPKSDATQTTASSVALGWLFVGVLGAIPLSVLGRVYPGASALAPADAAIFESMSAFTSTGLSMVSDQTAIPHCIQLWRSLAQWSGGLGMVIFALALLRASGRREALVHEEIAEHAVGDDVAPSVKLILAIYAGLTSATVVGFLVAGMPAWEAVNHGLTAVSTGGMTISPNSFASYGAAAKLVAMMAMFAGAMSFGLYVAWWRRRRGDVIWRSTQVRAFGLMLVAGGLAFWGAHRLRGTTIAPLDKAFDWVSAVSTSGFSSSTVGEWPTLVMLPVLVVMILGASAGSTAGGIKLARVSWLAKRVKRWLLREAALISVGSSGYTFDGEDVDEADATDHMTEAGVMAAVWLCTLTVTVGLLAVLEGGSDWRGLIFDATSALGGVGLSAGWASPDLTSASKLLLSVAMWMGRLEIVSVLALLLAPFSVARAGLGREAGHPAAPPEM